MPFKPNSPEGAKYPNCLCCDCADEALFVADPIELSDKNAMAVRKLPKTATREQREEAIIPGLLCADCAEQNEVRLLGELPWPPRVA